MTEKPDRVDLCEHNKDVWERMVDDGLLLATGLEDALIGYVERYGSPPVAIYDRDRCIAILIERDGMTYEGALDCFEFNTIGAWVGGGTPAYATLFHSHDTQTTKDTDNDTVDIHREQREES